MAMVLSAEDRAARAALRARQGGGARYDAEGAPSNDLLLARRATAFFARKLNGLDDLALCPPAHVPVRWTRAHIVAKLGYDARRMALDLEPLCPGSSHLPPESSAEELPSLDLAVTLPARALRYLFQHAAIHLDVCWRDLPEPAWDAQIALDRTGMVCVRDLPRLRAIELWRQVLALDCGATARDVPYELRQDVSKGDQAG
jgi:maleylpyruvate isomerase